MKDASLSEAWTSARHFSYLLTTKRYKIPYIIDEKRSISIIPSNDTNIEKVVEYSAAPVTDCTREPLTA